MDATVIFPHLGIEIENLYTGFMIGNFYIAYYGVIIAVGMVLCVLLSMLLAKKSGQDSDDILDVAIACILAGIVGARIYYVVFSMDEYHSFKDFFNIRQGGLAIYGGLIAGIIAIYFVCKVKKISFLRILDTIVPGVALAQAIGRWGNFFNKEAYGGYTDNLFAMQIRMDAANGVITEELKKNAVYIAGTKYIQVHPTFLYESAWCLLLCLLLLFFRKFAQYNGEVLLWYIGGYALERSFVEGLRTDQLLIGGIIPVSQLLSVMLLAGSFVLLLLNRIRIARGQWVPDYKAHLDPGDPGSPEFTKARIAARKEKKGKDWEVETIGKDDSETEEEAEADSEEEAEDAAEEASDAAEEVAEEFAEDAENAAEEAVESSEDAVEEVTDSAEEVIEEATEKVKE